MADKKQAVYLVFEGGGAKGIAHIGALQAIQETLSNPELMPLEIEAVAGTSIGAIIAAFVAAGADARGDLVDADGRLPLMSPRPNQPADEPRLLYITDVFRPSGWRRLMVIRWLIANSGPLFFNLIFATPFYAYGIYFIYVTYIGKPLIFISKVTAILIGIFVTNVALKFNQRSRSAIVLSEWLSVTTGGMILLIAIGAMRTFETFFDSNSNYTNYDVLLWLVDIFVTLYIIWLGLRRVLKGMVSLHECGIYLNQALARILATDGKQVNLRDNPTLLNEAKYRKLLKDKVRFSDLPKKLRVVSADIFNNKIHVWPNMNETDPVVADALLSSIAIPFLFEPHWTSSSAFVDGGIVSNIPAWAFRRHRTLNPDAYILAISVKPATAESKVIEFHNRREACRNNTQHAFRRNLSIGMFLFKNPRLTIMYPLIMFKHMVYTALFGARSLELDATDRLEVLNVSVDYELNASKGRIGVLDFDISQAVITTVIEKNVSTTRERLAILFSRRQKVFDDLCRYIINELFERAKLIGHDRSHLEDGGWRVSDAHRPVPGRIRIFLAEWQENAECLKIVRTHNFANDVDDRLYLPEEDTLAGMSHKMQRPILVSRSKLEDTFKGEKNRYRRAVKWPGLQWCWTIPFCTRVKSTGGGIDKFVLAIESNIPLDRFGRDMEEHANANGITWMKYRERMTKGESLEINDTESDQSLQLLKVAGGWQFLASETLSESMFE